MSESPTNFMESNAPMSESPTNFMESNALLAVQGGNRLEAMRILTGMLPHELRELGDAAYELGDMCRAHEREKRVQ